MFKYFLLMLFLAPLTSAFAQSVPDREIEIIIESAAENLPEDYDYTDLIARLISYRQQPLNLNKATAEQLQGLLFLSVLQITALQNHLRENGPLLDLLELQSVDLFDLQTIKRLLPFVTIKTDLDFKAISLVNLFRFGKNDLLLRYGQVLQTQKGFSIDKNSKLSHYTGGPEKLMARYRFDFQDKIRFNLNMEHDAGEPFFAGKNSTGFDFYSASLSLKNFGFLNRLVIGDYSLQFGQGLGLYTGFGFGKNADATLVPKVSRGLTPYSSTNEISYFRGAAATFAFKHLRFTPFLSYQMIDATVQSSGESSVISSLGTTGYHRTETELRNKNAVKQLTYGANVNFAQRNFALGFTAYNTQFQFPVQRKINSYNQYFFAGEHLQNLSLYYDYSVRNLYFFGETAKSLNTGFGTINGVLVSLSGNLSVVALYRNYQKNYQSLYNQAISEATEASNERGIYGGINYKFKRFWDFSGYADFFHFPWYKYQVSQLNSHGYELLGRLTVSPKPGWIAYLNYRYKNKQQNNDNAKILALDQVHYQDLRLDITYPVSEKFSLRNRLEMVKYQKGQPAAEFGWMAYQDVIYHPKGSKFSGNFRVAYFKTASYDSRIYSFENDVLYSYTVLPLQHEGLRTYVNLQIQPLKNLDFWARYSAYRYFDQQTVGSGLDLIQGKFKSEARVQIRYRF